MVFRIFLKSSKSDWTETFSRCFIPFLQTKKYTQIVKSDMCTFLFWSLIVKRINISALWWSYKTHGKENLRKKTLQNIAVD